MVIRDLPENLFVPHQWQTLLIRQKRKIEFLLLLNCGSVARNIVGTLWENCPKTFFHHCTTRQPQLVTEPRVSSTSGRNLF